MAECKFCFSTISDDNPVLIAEKIELAGLFWSYAENDGPHYGWPIGKMVDIPGVGEAEVVAKKLYTGPDGYGGDLPQGTEFDAFVVLKVGEQFFRKDGVGDSYNDITWNGPVRPVKPQTKQVTVYDF